MKKNLLIAMLSIMIATTGFLVTKDLSVKAKEVPALQVLEPVKHKMEPVYIICNVIDNYEDVLPVYDKYGNLDDYYVGTVLVCEMPNGELHQYGIQDAPEGAIDTVCFKTENQNDYSVYEVVAVDKKQDAYPRSGIITEIDEHITVTCANGNKYSFKTEIEDWEVGDWEVGDICSMLILDKGTETVVDDTVIDAWYDGFIELFEENESETK